MEDYCLNSFGVEIREDSYYKVTFIDGVERVTRGRLINMDSLRVFLADSSNNLIIIQYRDIIQMIPISKEAFYIHEKKKL